MIRKKEIHTLATLSRYFTGLAGRTTLRSWLSTGRLNTTSTGGEGRGDRFVNRKKGGRGAVEEIFANAHTSSLSLAQRLGDFAPENSKEPRHLPRLLHIILTTT